MAQPTASPGIDSRKRITPETLSVAPHLLGLPLASPSRRFAAILVDLLLVAILANVGGKVLFALLLGASFFWFAGRKLGKGGTFFSSSAKWAFRGLGTLFVFIAAIALFSRAQSSVEEAVGEGDGEGAPQAASAAGPAGGAGSVLTAVRMGANLHAVHNAPDSARAAAAALNAVRQMRRLGMTDAQIRAALREAATEDQEEAKPFVAGALRAAMPPPDSAAEDMAELPADSLAALYLAAVRGGDEEAVHALRPKLASVLARDSLDELRQRVSGLENDKRELARQVEEEEQKGILSALLKFLDDLGLGFGWIGLYFTAFTALWKGQTPGKKLFGIRVLRLDGLPMTLWASFERFGGYAAGLFTGLVGYAQVYWDRNRQAIQDKISETVVIRVVPGQPEPVAARPPLSPGYPLPPRPSPAAGWPSPPPSAPPPPAGTGQPFPRG